ncbi:MAG: Rieske 2Fe-2S domain-containing protein [Deltaproteobacteria bacterium]|nr:Rieske 2Fe-2S domain-containing protein [Deltaproteobacteria bacterium]MBW2498540.1 Rieske 2Fe-2S domain-containing protein [Deltaproteobacteria bacterium]
MAYVRVAHLGDIPTDRGLRVRVGEVAIGLYRVGDEVHAMEDACPHAGFPLSEGSLEGCVIVCRAHGWPFDVRTGFDPEHADGFPIPCFAVRVSDGEVSIDLENRVNDPRRQGRARGTP